MSKIIREKLWKVANEQTLIDKFTNMATAIAANNVNKPLKVLVIRLDPEDLEAEKARIAAEQARIDEILATDLNAEKATLTQQAADYDSIS